MCVCLPLVQIPWANLASSCPTFGCEFLKKNNDDNIFKTFLKCIMLSHGVCVIPNFFSKIQLKIPLWCWIFHFCLVTYKLMEKIFKRIFSYEIVSSCKAYFNIICICCHAPIPALHTKIFLKQFLNHINDEHTWRKCVLFLS